MIEKAYNLKIDEYTAKCQEDEVLCLGFFDCVHQGHLKLINRAKQIAFSHDYFISIFTFDNNPLRFFKNQKLLYTFDERCFVFEELQIDHVYKATFTSEFAAMDREVFLDNLLSNKSVKAIVVGEDYTFGKDKKGDTKYLKEYCDSHGIQLFVETLYQYNDKKLSTTNLRKLVTSGKLDELNSLLVSPYIIGGTIDKGRGVGTEELFPTANLTLDDDKISLAPGVYYTHVFIDGIRYRAATNVGAKPTYDISTYNVESYILFYTKKIYGKKIFIEFEQKLRDNKKFDSIEELKEQIQKDIDFICSQNGGY